MTSKLLEIKQFGQQIWLDNLSRELLFSGKLERLIKDDGISGITSNPSIFHKAISTDTRYQQDLKKLKKSDLNLEQRYEELVIPDIKIACDLLRPTYESTNYNEGYVSFELAPELANNVTATLDNARRLWHKIDRPNLMIKIPGTEAGILALETLISENVNINITLLFSLLQVKETWNAYIRGLNKRLALGQSLGRIKAVASFFLSRVDTAADSKLPANLQGTTAINLAKAAYQEYQNIFNSNKFAEFLANNAHPQNLLWASTGTKNPRYSDVMYIEELIGPNTINTVPDATLAAFRDHGVAENSLTKDIQNAGCGLEEIGKHVNLDTLGTELQLDGLKLFTQSFNSLIDLMK